MKMLSLILVFTTISFNLYSQSFRLKPTIGINYNIASISNVSNKAGRPGIDVGLLADMLLNKSARFEVGFMYENTKGKIQRGFKYPFNAPNLDAPQVFENYSFNLLKIPVSIFLTEQKASPLFASIGPVVKYNFSSSRFGYISNRPENYNNDFTIDTKGGNRFGVGIMVSAGKEFLLQKHKFSARLSYDADLTKWRYPTNHELEEITWYPMTNHTFSFQVSYIF